MEQGSSIRTICGELHQANGAARSGLHTESDHAGPAVMAGIKAGMGAESLALLQHAIKMGEATGLEAERVESVGLGGFPQGQQLIAEPHHVGVRDVFQTQIEGIREPATGLLATEHTAIKHLAGLFLSQPALGAHIAIAQLNSAVVKPHGRDHAVAIERVMNAVTIPLHPARAIAVKSAVELSWNRPTHRVQHHGGEFLFHVDEGAGPVAAAVAADGGDGHR